MRVAAAYLATVASFSAVAAHADDLTPPTEPAYDTDWLAPKVSTLGVGIEAGYRWNEHWALRGDVSAISFDYTYHDHNADLDNTARLFSTGLIADYHPYGGDFRLSAGARLSANEVEGDMRNLVKRGKNYTITIVDPLTHYTMRQNPIQPYLGTGYSYRVKDRISLDIDIGALYAGQPDLSVRSHAQQFGFTRREINNEIERQRDRLSKFQVYPVVEIGLKIQF